MAWTNTIPMRTSHPFVPILSAPHSDAGGTPENIGERPAVETALSGSETVLVVEDETLILSRITRVLQRNGYHVLAARNSEEALALLDKNPGPIHLLLTDIIMPGMNGRQLADRVSVLRPGVKLLFMSGYPAEFIGKHGILEANITFLEKPFNSNVLLRTLRQALDV